MKEDTFDLAIIGGGPAGYLAAERAAQGGLSVVLFEKRSLGGVCLNEGCIPTKSLLYSAKIFSNAAHGETYGVQAQGLTLDHNSAIQRKNKVVKTLVQGVKAKMRAGKIEVIYTTASIKGKTDSAFIIATEKAEYTAKSVMLCSGSEAILPPIPGLQGGSVYTSREILDIDYVPEQLVIVGGGVIGLEMADYFQTAGAHVTVIEMLDRIAGRLDREIAGILQEALTKKGVDFHLKSRVVEIKGGSVTVEKEGQAFDIRADAVLLCVGRHPATAGLGLENIGISIEKGAVVTDNRMRTNVPGIYAAGDNNGKSMLAHTAYREAEVAVNNLLGKKDAMRYDIIPSVVYTTPEAASVGETEETAKEHGLSYEVKKLPLTYAGRYIAENTETGGLCKAIVEKGTERLLGVQLIGSYASEIILAAGVMIESRLPLSSLRKIIFAHPTVGEIIRETIFH